MPIKEAIIRLGIHAQDKASAMLDRVGLAGDKIARSFAKVQIEAKQAGGAIGRMSKGATDIKSMGSMFAGAARAVSSFIDGMREMEIAGEKALNAQRSLQLMIGDTQQVLIDATTATSGLVEATNLEVLIRKFAGLGIPIKDVMTLLESATRLSHTSQKDIMAVGDALMGAMSGRTTSLKLMGVEIEAIDATAKGISAAIDKALGGAKLDVFVTAAQQKAVFLANVKSNNEVLAAKEGALSHALVGGMTDAMAAAAALTVNLKEVNEVTDQEVTVFGDMMRITREVNKIVHDSAEAVARDELPAQRQITEQLERQLKFKEGTTATQIALSDEVARLATLRKQTLDSTQAERDLERDIQESLHVQIGLKKQIAAEAVAMAPILDMIARTQRIIAGKDPKKPRRRGGGRRRGKLGATFADTMTGTADAGPAPLLMTAGVADDAQLRAIAETVHAFEELDTARAESHAAVQAAMKARDDGASLQRALDGRAQLEQDHANRIRDINFELNEALAEADRERLAEAAARSAAAYTDQAERIAQSVEDSISGFGQSGDHMSGLTQAFRGAATGGIALAKSYDDVKKGTPGFIAAIGQATASQVSNESARAGIMAGITMADAIHAFLVTPPPGTRYDLLAWGAVAAAMYGAQAAMPSTPGAAAGGAGAKGTGSRVSSRPLDVGAGGAGDGFTVNFYANAPIVHGGTQAGASELAGIALSVAGTGMGAGGAV